MEILYEDEHLLAVNKPAGLLAVPDRWDKTKEHLVGILHMERPGQYLANVHRLDKNTTGVFCLAKTKAALSNLVEQLGSREVRKVYVALCHGEPAQGSMMIDLPIGLNPKARGLCRVDHGQGKPARTELAIVERFTRWTLLRLQLHSGRQHQIRVHLRAIGCPVVGDTDYGGLPLLLSQIKPRYKAKLGEVERPLLARPALHAEELTVHHPCTNKMLTIQAPWPKDLELALKSLRRFAVR